LVVAESADGDRVRYKMLEPVRQYAEEKLEKSGEANNVRHRHAAFFLALAEEAEPELWGPEEPTWLQRLEVEHDNLRAALTWVLERGEAELGLRLAGALRWFWTERGYTSEGHRWSELVLARDEGRASATARVKVLEAVGWLALDLGDLNRTEAIAREGIKLSEETGVRGSLAASFFDMLGMLANIRGENQRAASLFEEGLVLNREAGDKRGLTFSLFNLGVVALDRGEHVRAKELFEESRTLCRMLGDVRSLPKYSYALGYECLLQGDYERATELFEEAVAMCRERGRMSGLNDALDKLGWAELARGNPERAKTLYKESLALCVELDDRWIAPESLEGLACIAGAEGESERAAKLFGAARMLQETLGYHQPPAVRALREPYLAAARSRLDESLWKMAFAEGKDMAFEEAVEYALSDEEEPFPTASPVPEEPSIGRQPIGLTRREREVATLVARGLSNRRIAKELFVSERTIENHVAKILKKLSLSSREQVATRLDDH
jgi:DNA-binding CsgD family transcriptional regulator